MSIHLFPRTVTRRPALKARRMSLALEGLEERLVMSNAAATLPIPAAQVAAQPQANVSVPITLTGINLTSITRDVDTTHALTAVGKLTGTILGHAFSTPLTATITPGANPQTCPVLNLHLDEIHLNLLGLKVDTSKICLDITATEGPGNLLGNLLCPGLEGILDAADKGSPVNGPSVLGSLNTLLNTATTTEGQTLLGGLTAGLGQVTGGFAPTAATTQILHLSLGPVSLSLLGLNVDLDNCNNGPVTVDITAVSGPGNLLGNLLGGVAHLLDNPGNPLGGIQSHVNNILTIVTNSPAV